jgi:glycerol uptake facilitator-like aquaporin
MNKYLVELFGTALLSFVIFSTGNYLAIAAALAIGILLGGPISGAAYNPAITVALMMAGKLAKKDLIPYIIAQIIGALAGYYLFKNFMK